MLGSSMQMSGPYPFGIYYDALKWVSATGKVSQLHMRATSSVTGSGVLTDRGPVLDFTTGITTESSAFCTNYPGGCFGGTVAEAVNFSKPFSVLLPFMRHSNQAQTTARFIIRGTNSGGIAAIDATNWGIEIVIVAETIQLRACKLSAGGVLTSGAAVAFTNGNVHELTHDPAVGCSLLSGVTGGALASIATIATHADYPVADSTDGLVVAGIIRAGGADTTTRNFYCGRSCWVKYNRG